MIKVKISISLNIIKKSYENISRQRVFKMITPIWQEQSEMGIELGQTASSQKGVTVNENKLLRLAFHDCIPYEDGTGGQSCQN